MRGRHGATSVLSRGVRRTWRSGLPVVAVRGRYLGTGYPDQDVSAMGAEDGQILLGTQAWGDNRDLDGELAVRRAAVTHAVAVRQGLDTALGRVSQAHAHAVQRFGAGRISARTALGKVTEEWARLAVLRKKLAERGLEPPTSPWKVTALLGILGLGDMAMTSVAMEVLNISDRPYVSWLPFSALQVAAVPVVFGMLIAAHFLGESIKAHRHEPTLHPLIKIIGAASLAGGLCLALSVAAIRTAFLSASGVQALTLPFIGIQLGLFAVAVAASAWAAHPYRAQWRQAARAVRRAARGYRTARRSAGRLAGIVNALACRHSSLVAQAVDSAEAVLSDGIRQGHLYRRGHQHGLPEPASEQLYTGPVSEGGLPGPVAELLEDYPAVGPESHLTALESVTLDDLDSIWMALQQMQGQAGIAGQAEERPGRPLAAADALHGVSYPGTISPASVNGNGTFGTGA